MKSTCRTLLAHYSAVVQKFPLHTRTLLDSLDVSFSLIFQTHTVTLENGKTVKPTRTLFHAAELKPSRLWRAHHCSQFLQAVTRAR